MCDALPSPHRSADSALTAHQDLTFIQLFCVCRGGLPLSQAARCIRREVPTPCAAAPPNLPPCSFICNLPCWDVQVRCSMSRTQVVHIKDEHDAAHVPPKRLDERPTVSWSGSAPAAGRPGGRLAWRCLRLSRTSHAGSRRALAWLPTKQLLLQRRQPICTEAPCTVLAAPATRRHPRVRHGGACMMGLASTGLLLACG